MYRVVFDEQQNAVMVHAPKLGRKWYLHGLKKQDVFMVREIITGCIANQAYEEFDSLSRLLSN